MSLLCRTFGHKWHCDFSSVNLRKGYALFSCERCHEQAQGLALPTGVIHGPDEALEFVRPHREHVVAGE